VIEVDGEDITLIRLGQGSIEGILDLVQMPEPEPVAASSRRGRR
jgi:hypothetical protein